MMANFGDIAMLRMAVERLLEHRPDARIAVITSDETAMKKILPRARAVCPRGRSMWLDPSCQFGRIYKKLPRLVTRPFRIAADWIQRRHPEFGLQLCRWHFRHMPRELELVEGYLEELRRADLVMVTGGGFINDVFGDYALQLLSTAVTAVSFGARVVMLGQGIGPLVQPRLRAAAGRALRACSLVTVREMESRSVARELGATGDRVVLTGDDATELAYRLRPPRLGSLIGFNIRIAEYSSIDENQARRIARAVDRLMVETGSPMAAIPISQGKGESDIESMERIVEKPIARKSLDTIEDLIRTAGECRIAIVGSYHAAVFCLAQGVGVVALVGSDYYHQKMKGLADQYGNVGCRVIRVDAAGDLEDRILEAARRMWNEAHQHRQPLLDAALGQITLARKAFARIFDSAR